MLGLGVRLAKASTRALLDYVKDGLKLYMPTRGTDTTKGTQFVGEGSCSFDGGDYIDCGTGLGTALGDNYSGSLSMSLWFKADVTSGSDGLFDIIDDFGGTPNSMFRVRLDSGNIEFWLNGTGWMREYSFSDTSSWHHLVVIYNTGGATDSKMYLDGVAVGTIDGTYNTFPVDADMDFSGKNTIIGACYSSSYAFDGIINEVSLWGTEFTLAQVQELFNDGVPLDATTHSVHTSASTNLKGYWRNDGASTWTDRSTDYSNNGTPAGSPDTILLPEGITSGKDILGFPLTHTNNGWLNLDGTEYVNVTDNSVLDFGTGGITMEAWIKLDDYTASEIGSIIVKRTSDARYQMLWRGDSSDKIECSVDGDAGSANDFISATSAISDNNWHHIVATIDHSLSEAKIYIDSSQSGSTDTGSTAGSVNPAADLKIGVSHSSANYFKGSLDEIKIYSKVLSAAEITKNYKHGKSKHS